MTWRDSITRILVRATNWVGDLILMTPALTALHRAFPAAAVTVVATPRMAELLAANPDVDDLILYDRDRRHRGVSGRLALIREMRSRQFALGIVFQHAFEGALLLYLAGIPVRVGYRTEGRQWLLTHPVRLRPGLRHHVDQYLELLEAVGVKPDHGGLVLRLSPGAVQEAERLLSQEGIKPEACLVGLNPGAAYGPAKRWPADRFGTLAHLLSDRLGATPIVLGASPDREVVERVLAQLRGRFISLAGKTTLSVAAAVIARCRTLVTNDSGLMHVGAALGVPVVAIFGPTDPVLTGPVGSGHRVLRKPVACSPCQFRICPIDHRCMEWVTAEEVYEAVAGQLRSCA